jgi:RNA polymerase primary sigma factor
MYIDETDEISISNFHKELNNVKRLTAEEEKLHIRLAKEGDTKSKELLIKSHLKFIYSVAKKYVGQGVPLSDLISEGCIGFLKGIDRFNESENIKLITYAVWWIKEAITLHITNYSRTVRLPMTTINKLRDGADDVDTVNKLSTRLSIDSAYGLTDEDTEYSATTDTIISKRVDKLLECLNDREQVVIKNSFGIDGLKPLTLDEIGSIYGITMERIRQIKKEAIFKMRENSYELLELIENEKDI